MDELVSKGSFGKVYKVTRISDGRVFALKEVDLEGMKRAEREEAMDEARMLSQLASPHVIRYHEAFLEEGRLYIVMEYAARGTIHGCVRARGRPRACVRWARWRVRVRARESARVCVRVCVQAGEEGGRAGAAGAAGVAVLPARAGGAGAHPLGAHHPPRREGAEPDD
ncbi:unnamed protein product [Pedinophyceae sp. YPF-701]|nr:unnamed protein product [Pedinophyceae sp. YPF-701]